MISDAVLEDMSLASSVLKDKVLALGLMIIDQ